MSRRLLAIAVITVFAGICIAVSRPMEAAPFRKSTILERRMARLQKNAQVSSSKVRSSFSSSLNALAWDTLRRNKRRGGGGHTISETASSSSAHTLLSPTITFTNITKNYGSAAFALSPLSDSDGSFSFTSSDTSVATIAGNTVTIVGAGTTTITVTQAATDNFTSGTVSATLTVNTIAPTIIALISISKTTTDLPFVLSDPVSNSAGAFTFRSTNTSVATISGRTVTIVGAGTTTIISTQAANGNYKIGSGVTILTVTPGLEESDGSRFTEFLYTLLFRAHEYADRLVSIL